MDIDDVAGAEGTGRGGQGNLIPSTRMNSGGQISSPSDSLLKI